MTTPEQLFEHELMDVYYAEKTIEKMLPKLASEASDPMLTRAFEYHLDETRQQIKNLEQVFSALGKRAHGETCPGIEGIKAEHDKFMREEDASADVRDMFLTGAAARTEHYEIAAYTGLIAKARSLGETSAAKLLNENLRQEKEALKTVESISKDLLEASTPTNGGNGHSRGGTRRRSSSSARKSTSSSRRSSR
jgi:ferritin-like metal-binding protein YciE